MITNIPHAIDAITARSSGRSSNGTAKLRANTNLFKNVDTVAAQICSVVDDGSASSARCIPNASDMASATAMTRIPPSTAASECVPALRPVIRPSVVMTPDVAPKKSPVRTPLLLRNPSKCDRHACADGNRSLKVKTAALGPSHQSKSKRSLASSTEGRCSASIHQSASVARPARSNHSAFFCRASM